MHRNAVDLGMFVPLVCTMLTIRCCEKSTAAYYILFRLLYLLRIQTSVCLYRPPARLHTLLKLCICLWYEHPSIYVCFRMVAKLSGKLEGG